MSSSFNVFVTQQFRSFFIAAISFFIDRKQLKIAETSQINQLFQLLNLICIQGDVFCGLIRMLMSKNVPNEVRKDLPLSNTRSRVSTNIQKWVEETSSATAPLKTNPLLFKMSHFVLIFLTRFLRYLAKIRPQNQLMLAGVERRRVGRYKINFIQHKYSSTRKCGRKGDKINQLY